MHLCVQAVVFGLFVVQNFTMKIFSISQSQHLGALGDVYEIVPNVSLRSPLRFTNAQFSIDRSLYTIEGVQTSYDSLELAPLILTRCVHLVP